MNNQPYYLDYATWRKLLHSFGYGGGNVPTDGTDADGNFDYDEYVRQRQARSAIAAGRGTETLYQPQLARTEYMQPMPRNTGDQAFQNLLMNFLRARNSR